MLHAPITYRSNDDQTDFTINDRTVLDANWTGGDPYYISVDSVDGLYSADIETESHPIPMYIGERSGDIFRRGKSITVTGTIWAGNWGSLGVGAEYLAEMFYETLPRKLLFYPLVNATEIVYIYTRIQNDLSVSMSKPTDLVYRWGWTVNLRADDPRMYLDSDTSLYRSWMV